MLQIFFYVSAFFIGQWMGENLQPTPLIITFGLLGLVISRLLRDSEGLSAIPAMLAGIWSAVCFMGVIIGYFRTEQQTFIGDFLREFILR